MKNSRKRVLILMFAFILVPLSMFLCVYWVDIAEYLDNMRDQAIIEETRKLIPTYEPEYNRLLNDLRNLTEDDLLRTNQSGLFVRQDSLTCIAGFARFDFGTDRPYEEVVEEYTRKLTSAGWVHSECFQCEAAQNFYDIKTARLVILLNAHNEDANGYSTFYYVSLDFGQPGIPCLRAYW